MRGEAGGERERRKDRTYHVSIPPLTPFPDEVVLRLYAKLGSNWAKMRDALPGRSSAAIKHRWNATLHKQMRPADVGELEHADIHQHVANTNWSRAEDQVVLHLYSEFGKMWGTISQYLPGRSENAIKQRWNVHIRK